MVNEASPVEEATEQEVIESNTTVDNTAVESSKDSLEAAIGVESVEEANDEPVVETTEYELPSKFKGKEVQDIVAAYENLEKELGRKGQEIGELRQLSDDFLRSQITSTQETKTENEQVDFFEDPEAAVRRILDNHPQLRELQEHQLSSTRTAAQETLATKHPDYKDILGNESFKEWVSGSRFRTDLYKQADSYDYDAANELFTDWKERQMIAKTQEVTNEQETKRQEGLKAGKTESRSSMDSTAGKKIYRRADLIRLKQQQPNRYNELADEIFQAYSEGRVK